MVPTEGSDLERPAINMAVRLAQRFEAELRLVRVEASEILAASMLGAADSFTIAGAVDDSRLARLRYLEALGSECRELGGIRVVTALEEGAVGPTLKQYAERFNVDLIVMPSHARGGVSRLTLGSVADYLIRRADVPVLVVKTGLYSATTDPMRTFTRIVVPLDGSELAEQILPHVVDVASRLHSTVNLLTVLTPQTYSQTEIMQPGLPWWDDDIKAANSYLDGAAHYLTARGLSVSKDVVLSESIATAILDYADRANADLIAIATSGSGGVGRFIFGSVADEITRKSQTSLLVFHPAPVTAVSHRPTHRQDVHSLPG
jgi:nucleotide-binding universal stress UspA family protein